MSSNQNPQTLRELFEQVLQEQRNNEPEPFTVPEERKGVRSQNDVVWRQVSTGPDKSVYADFSADQDLDDVVTTFSKEWLAAVQATTNMLAILNKIVNKYQIRAGQIPRLPSGISQIFAASDSVLKAQEYLTAEKDTFFVLGKIREGWGSLSAYANAPVEERTKWLETNIPNAGNDLQEMLMMLEHMQSLIGGCFASQSTSLGS